MEGVGGWGDIVGDEGRGYEMGVESLKWVIKRDEGIVGGSGMRRLIVKGYGVGDMGDVK